MAATMAAAPIGGILISVGILSGAGSVPPGVSAFVGWNAGLLGWLVGGVVEEFVQPFLYWNRVGVTKGSRIVQASGLGAYGCILAAAISGAPSPERSPQPVDPAPTSVPVPAKSIPTLPTPPSPPSAPKVS